MHIRRRSNTPSISLEPQLQTDNYRVLILPKPTSQNPRHRFGPQPKGMTAGFWHILPIFRIYWSNTPSISLGPQPQTDNCRVLIRIRNLLFFSLYFLLEPFLLESFTEVFFAGTFFVGVFFAGAVFAGAVFA